MTREVALLTGAEQSSHSLTRAAGPVGDGVISEKAVNCSIHARRRGVSLGFQGGSVRLEVK